MRRVSSQWRFTSFLEKLAVCKALHYWHCQCWDHDVCWCWVALSDKEINFCFSVLPRITGLCHFKNGITKLKHVCGRTRRDVQQYLMAIIAGGVPLDVIIAIHMLMEFRYLSQAPAITSQTQDRIQAALDEFHDHKQAILNGGFHWDKRVMDHFWIPKLELMQSMVPSIPWIGCLLQWSADTTEHNILKLSRILLP